MDINEVGAAAEFIAQFLNKYGPSSHLLLYNLSLNRLIELVYGEDVPRTKMILLYFHNEDDNFCQLFCENLISLPMASIAVHYCLLGWNVKNGLYTNVLQQAFRSVIDIDMVCEKIENKEGAALIIGNVNNSLTVLSMLSGKHVSLKTLRSTLKMGCAAFDQEQKIEQPVEYMADKGDSFGTKQFQQMMCDGLKDRDFDKYEFDQHNHLKGKIGFAFYGPPAEESGYNSKQKEQIDQIYNQIVKHNNKYAEWPDQVIMRVIYNCLEPLPAEKLKRAKKNKDYNPNCDMVPIPVFVIRKCFEAHYACQIFVDHEGRVYSSFHEYINENKLGKFEMTLPKNGKYSVDGNGNVLLETHLSPSCAILTKILKVTDVATSVAGIVSGGVFGLAAFVAVAPVATLAAGIGGIGVGIYSMFRSGQTITDKIVHDDDMSFSNSEARSAYINLVAGSLSFVGAGATRALSYYAAKGADIGKGVQYTVNAITGANIVVSGGAICSSTYDVIDNWDNHSPGSSALAIVQLSSSVLFFGHAVYNFRTANNIIRESQTTTLRSYLDDLKNNRHRKMFNKLVKETFRQNGGNEKTANSAIIKTIRSIGTNRDEVFSTLVRNNKMFNREGARFSADDGVIKLNGIDVDILKFREFNTDQKSAVLKKLPAIPEPKPNAVSDVKVGNVKELVSNWATLDKGVYVLDLCGRLITLNSFNQVCELLLREFSGVAKEKIYQILCHLSSPLSRFIKSSNEGVITLTGYVLKFLLEIVTPLTSIRTTHKEYIKLSEDALDTNVKNGVVNQKFLKRLSGFIYNKLEKQIIKRLRQSEAAEKNRNRSRVRNMQKCIECYGMHYYAE